MSVQKHDPESPPEVCSMNQLESSYEAPLVSDTTQPPPWLDRDRFKKGQDFVRKYPVGVLMSNFLAVISHVLLPTLFKVIVYFRKYEGVQSCLQLSIGLLSNGLTWYEGDLWDPNDPAHRSMKRVHRKHTRLAEFSNKFKHNVVEAEMDTSNVPEIESKCTLFEKLSAVVPPRSTFAYPPQVPQDKTYMTQYDFIVTSMNLSNAILTAPHKIGIHGATDQEMEDYIYMMRVITYHLGVEDRYNPFFGNLQQMRSLVTEYKNEVIVAHPTTFNKDQEFFGRIVLHCGNMVSTFFRLLSLFPESVAMYVAWVNDVPQAIEVLRKVVPWYTQAYFRLLILLFTVVLKIPGISFVAAYLGRVAMKKVKDMNREGIQYRKVR